MKFVQSIGAYKPVFILLQKFLLLRVVTTKNVYYDKGVFPILFK